jgi:hypothetical protein
MKLRIAALLTLAVTGCAAPPAILPGDPFAGLEVTADGCWSPAKTTPAPVPRFETLCPPEYTEDFVSALQRALQVRGAYNGRITGDIDIPTRLAILAWQSARGLESDRLSRATAQGFGLVPVTLGARGT